MPGTAIHDSRLALDTDVPMPGTAIHDPSRTSCLSTSDTAPTCRLAPACYSSVPCLLNGLDMLEHCVVSGKLQHMRQLGANTLRAAAMSHSLFEHQMLFSAGLLKASEGIPCCMHLLLRIMRSNQYWGNCFVGACQSIAVVVLHQQRPLLTQAHQEVGRIHPCYI